ncbi:PREDICTED: uncharacterized protein LOC109467480 isoform X2 [Branchiostoma belcheri]|uniref:Uncharacterized protein LOC109467480 isoform X2 n=1 Tax=Branchiostoma belcheri TaxID=7741 RepID=A0A6P4Y998_BRABE|nr:PREDICTED: uncharacterized protein LOC109467480 isoform X2 [Branchiostoma belcheri]
MLILLLSTLALAGAQHRSFDANYNFGQLQQPIDTALVFDCGSNPNRALQNPKFTFRSTDPNADPNQQSLTLPGSFILEDFEIEVTKPIVRPFYGRVEAWRTIWLLGGASSTIQLGCIGLSTDNVVGIDGFGTCDYGDLCSILDLNIPINDTTGQPTCFPEAINQGIPEDQCTCEGIIAPKVYATQGYNRLIDFTDLEPGMLTFLAEGDYEFKLIAEDDQGNEEACIAIRVPIKEYVDPNDTGGGWFFGKRR